MKKKFLAVTLAMAMAMSICACGEKQTVTSETQGSEAQQSVVASETNTVVEDEATYPIVKEGDEPITITIATTTPDTTVREDRLVWNKVAEVTGIDIEWVFIEAEALATYLASDEWPDAFHMTNAVMKPALVNDYGVYGGRFVNYLEKLDIMPNYAQTLEEYPSARKVTTLSNGEAYNTAYVSIAVTDVTPRLFYRSDLMEQIGMKAPTTVEEFKATLVKAKEVFGKAQYIYPATSGLGTGSEYPLFSAFGPDNDMKWNADDNGKVSYARATEQCKLFYSFMNELYEEELIHQEYPTLEQAAKVEYEKDNCLYVFAASEKLTTDDFADGQFHIGAIGALTSEYDDTADLIGRLPAKNANGFYINAESEYVDEICKLIDIAYATEEVVEGSGLYGISFTYGMENEHWKFSGDSYEFITPESYKGANNTFVAQEVRYMNYGRFDTFAGMVTLTPGNGQARQNAMVNDIWPDVEEEASVFPTSQLTFTEDEQEVIDMYWTEIETYSKQMETEFIMGISDIDAKWDEYVANLEKMHLADVTAAWQSAYDRWLAN